MKTTAALRLLYHVYESQRPALTKALFRAYWVEGKNVSDKSVLVDAVRSSNISKADDAVAAIKDGTFEGDRERKELETATDLAVQRGTPGVPAFWIPEETWTDREGNEQKGRLYWGQDRMHFVEAVLLALNEGENGQNIGLISKPLQSLIPRCVQPRKLGGGDGQVKVEFWYDFSSPWAFLGWTQLARLQRQFGPSLVVDMKPFLLGILFREYVDTISRLLIVVYG